MGAAVKAAGGGFLEAPVSGSKGPAEQGALIFLTAGDEAVKDAAAADLEAMGKAVRAPVTRRSPAASDLSAPAHSSCSVSLADRAVRCLQTFYFGPEVGRGSRMKLVVNMIMGTHATQH